jgi:hypothetical protein
MEIIMILGVWSDGHREGRGCITFADGSGYAGEFKKDRPHGKGTCRWQSGPLVEFTVSHFLSFTVLSNSLFSLS